jgi:hypothetical protein
MKINLLVNLNYFRYIKYFNIIHHHIKLYHHLNHQLTKNKIIFKINLIYFNINITVRKSF